MKKEMLSMHGSPALKGRRPLTGRILLVRRQGWFDLGEAHGGRESRWATSQRARHDHAAVAGATECVVVTDNEKDFAGIPFVNPMRGSE